MGKEAKEEKDRHEQLWFVIQSVDDAHVLFVVGLEEHIACTSLDDSLNVEVVLMGVPIKHDVRREVTLKRFRPRLPGIPDEKVG